MIVIGIDPHKRTHTAVAIAAATGELRGELTVAACPAGHRALLRWAEALAPARRWALEDCRHVSGALERFLLEHGEPAVRVPPKLMAGLRRGGRERGKSDPIDALAVARAALREPQLAPARRDERARELKLLVDQRQALVGERTRAQSRLRWLLHELELELDVPPRALDRRVWMERLARRLRRREGLVAELAGRLLRRCRALSAEIAELERELERRVRREAPALLELPGCGVLTAARLVAEIGTAGRFDNDAQLALHAGVAPLEVSSGQRRRHRLNRTGNRQLNCALHVIAITQARLHEPAQRYLARKQAEGKSKREALRCLKRHLARAVFKLLQPAARPPACRAELVMA